MSSTTSVALEERPELQIFVRLPDGSEASYPLQPGQHRIGGDGSCSIVIQAQDVAPFHAILDVTPENLHLVNLQQPDSVLLDGEPVEQQVPLCLGDVFQIGSVRLEVLRTSESKLQAHLVAPAGTLPLHERLERILALGEIGYRASAALLAQEVSSDEAAGAQRSFRRSMFWFSLTVLTYLVLVGLKVALLPASHATGRAVVDNVLLASVLVATLILVSRWGVAFAGRVNLCLTALTAQEYAPSADWNGVHWVGLGVVVIAWGLGGLLDYGASTAPGRAHPRLRRWILTGIGGLLVGGQLIGWRLGVTGDVFPLCGVMAGLLCAVWPWWPARRWSQRRQQGVADEETVLHVAQVRWWNLGLGHALAIGLSLLPFFMFLKALDVEERLAWPEAREAVITRHGVQPPTVYFWLLKGRYLRPGDFQEFFIYGYPRTAVPAELSRGVAEKLRMLQADQTSPATGQAYDALQKMLNNYRLRDVKDFEACVTADDRCQLIFLLQEQTYPDPADPQGKTISHASYLDSRALLPLTQEQAEERLQAIRMPLYSLLGIGLLGFIILWRRGGDSPLGRWIGLWLLAVSFCGYWTVSQTYLPAVFHSLWSKAVSLPLASTGLGLLTTMPALHIVLACLLRASIPLAAIWVYLCWPSRHHESVGVWMRLLVGGGKILLVALALTSLKWAVDQVIVAANATLPSAVALQAGQLRAVSGLPRSLAVLAVMLAFGRLFRRRWARFSEVPRLGWLPPLAFGLLLVGLSLILVESADWSQPLTGHIAGRLFQVCVALSVLLTVYILVRGNFLRISPVRDMMVLVAVFVLPLLFTYIKDVSQDVLRHMGLGHRGAHVVAILIVVGLVEPVAKALEHFVALVTLPAKLRSLEHAVAGMLDSILDNRSGLDPHREVARLLLDCGVEQYVFYSRVAEGNVEMALSHMDVEVPSGLPLSEHLRQHLSTQKGFLDLDTTPFEWQHFFYQFELLRLQQQTRCRYLLPLCLGPSLCGLLLLPDRIPEEAINHESLAGRLSAIGLAVVRMG